MYILCILYYYTIDIMLDTKHGDVLSMCCTLHIAFPCFGHVVAGLPAACTILRLNKQCYSGHDIMKSRCSYLHSEIADLLILTCTYVCSDLLMYSTSYISVLIAELYLGLKSRSYT